jgi:MSHA biogenesis protein MshI
MLKLKEVFNQWTKRKEAPGAVGVYLCNDSISMVHISTVDPSHTEILANQHILCGSDTEKQAALQSFVQKHGLESTTCHTIIELQDYKVTLLDAPPVAEAELIPSVRWMLKDVINYPLDEACVDVFHIPMPRARDNMKLVYAVVAPLKNMLAVEHFIRNSGLNLCSLGIPELALRNALWFFGEITRGGLLIYLHKNLGKLIIIDDKAIHMVRNIDLRDNAAETLILEIQRYLDYSTTLFRQNLCTQFLMTPNSLSIEIASQIKTALDTETVEIPFVKFFPNGSNTPKEQQAPLLVALGAALSGKNNEKNKAPA